MTFIKYIETCRAKQSSFAPRFLEFMSNIGVPNSKVTAAMMSWARCRGLFSYIIFDKKLEVLWKSQNYKPKALTIQRFFYSQTFHV